MLTLDIVVSELHTLESQHRWCLSNLTTSQPLCSSRCRVCRRRHSPSGNYSRTTWCDCSCSRRWRAGCSGYGYYNKFNMRGIWQAITIGIINLDSFDPRLTHKIIYSKLIIHGCNMIRKTLQHSIAELVDPHALCSDKYGQ